MRCFSNVMSQQVKFWITSCWWRIILDLFTHSEQHLNGGGANLGILENQIFLDLRGRSFEIWSWTCSVTAVGLAMILSSASMFFWIVSISLIILPKSSSSERSQRTHFLSDAICARKILMAESFVLHSEQNSLRDISIFWNVNLEFLVNQSGHTDRA